MSQKVTPLSAEQIIQLAAMQDHLNQLTCQANFGHPDWRDMNFNWGDAIVDEVMEIKGHMGWKWWKGSQKYQVGVTPENKKQIQLEVIDILHFALSHSIEYDNLPGMFYQHITRDLNQCLACLIETHDYDWFEWDVWYRICELVDLDASQIMETYIGKYALNIFRQDNGYGDGSYQKMWSMDPFIDPEEDNVYLERAINEIKEIGQQVTVDSIDQFLTAYYNARIKE